MPEIKLPDGKKLTFEKKVSGLQIAEKISKSLAKQALIMIVDGELKIGLWQGIYIWEHRTSNKSRSLQLHAIGDFDLN